MAETRLPLTLIGGFLGAGKSTWLRHQLHEGRFARHHLIVNEAAQTPVDNLLLGGAGQISMLAGGCACCEGLPALIALLSRLCDKATGDDAGAFDALLLETSGLADPGAIAQAIANDPILTRRLILRQSLVLVDARHNAAQLRDEPLARAQIEAADELIITKSADQSPEATARLIATLRGLNPEAPISAAELGMPYSLPDLTATAYELPILHDQGPIRPYRLEIGENGGWLALSTWLSALLAARGEDVVRVKGVVRTPAGRLLLQSVRRVVQAPEILPESNEGLGGPAPEEGRIVLIGRNINGDLLARSWAKFGG